MNPSKNQILFFGLTAHLLAAFFSIGYHQCDELFQVYEFAGYKLGLNTAAELPWEFHEQMRSGIQPFVVYGITKLLHALSVTNPFSISFLIRLLQSVFSFTVMVRLLNYFEKEMHTQKLKSWLWAFGLLFWCLPYFHARFSSENFSATLFTLGFVFLLDAAGEKTSAVKILMAGLLLGIAFVCRFQVSFMIAGLFAWLIFIRKIKWHFLWMAACGIVFALGLGLFADKWLYGHYTLSWWNYLEQNLFQDKASHYGREPFYFYLGEALLQLIPPFSLVIVFAIVGFWIKFKKHVFTWMTLPFILLHCFVSHKELRFLFPMLNFLPFMILYFFQSVHATGNKFYRFISHPRFISFAVVVNTVTLIYFVFKPADNGSVILKKIYETVQGGHPVLLFEDRNPYNNLASLNYFRNTNIQTLDVKNDSTQTRAQHDVYYFSEKFNVGDTLILKNNKFTRLYSFFPAWFKYLNFNGWLDRAGTFSIYKKE